jgi:hypothetical protein
MGDSCPPICSPSLLTPETDALEDLTRELAATKKTLGTLIAWSVLELGEQNTQRLLDMMSPENANVDLPDTAAQDSASKSNNPAVSG